MTIRTVNPANGEILASYKLFSPALTREIIDLTHSAYLQWKETSFEHRATLLRRAAQLLQDNKATYATLMSNEMGKPISAAEAEVDKCAWVCNYYADHGEALLKPRIIETDMQKSYVTYRPNGVIFAIMPWNFPMWQVFRFAAPNLMAGHGCLLKHAPISTGTALAIEALCQQAGFPEHLFRTLVIDNEEAAHVIANEKVSGVTLTGSERAGKSVGMEAGKNLKKVVLELGGCDPYLILRDADLDKATEASVNSRLNNSGQVCIAAKRIIAVESIYSDIKERIVEKIKSFTVGNPLDKNTDLGPMARQDLRQTVHMQVVNSVKEGATLIEGGEIPSGPGFYYPITVLADVGPEMTAFKEEVFGPVIALIKAKNENHAIELANQSAYGLSAAVFTEDLERGENIAANKIRTGTCAVNTFVKSDPRLPFGGIKNSGYGRELADEGIHAFMNVKTVVVG